MLTYILSRTVCQISLSIDQIIALDSGCLYNEFVLRNLSEYRYKSYIAKKATFYATYISQAV